MPSLSVSLRRVLHKFESFYCHFKENVDNQFSLVRILLKIVSLVAHVFNGFM